MRAALVQLTVSDDPAANLPVTVGYIRQAIAQGAGLVLTPELSNGLSSSRAHQRSVFRHEEEDETLAALRTEAKSAGIWLLIGSLGLLTHDADGRFANRSFLIAPDGSIAARYDKIHMFDVNVSATEVYRESDGYRPGSKAVLADTPFAKIGMTVCYDVRFPALYRQLAQSGAQVITVPAAFNHITGAAHWETLLRARAIETGCFVLAPAQTGFPRGKRQGPQDPWAFAGDRSVGGDPGRRGDRPGGDTGRPGPRKGRRSAGQGALADP
jgi:predicted amidohydrolase